VGGDRVARVAAFGMMGRHARVLPPVAGGFVLAAIAYTASGLYTFPGTVSRHSRVVRSLIRQTLDRRERERLPVPDLLDLQPADTVIPSDVHGLVQQPWGRIPPSYSPDARRWTRRAALADSAGLRAWLNEHVFVTPRARGDTMTLTWRRLTRHPGCPWVSTLRATLVERPDRSLHLVRVTATCPPHADSAGH